jgi:hypothetical protein
MIAILGLLLHIVVSPFRTKARLEAEIILLRHQLNVLRGRVSSKPKLAVTDRLVFVWLYRLFPSVLNAVAIVQSETILRWHRKGLRLNWRWKSRARGGRPKVSVETLPPHPPRTFAMREMLLEPEVLPRTQWPLLSLQHRLPGCCARLERLAE